MLLSLLQSFDSRSIRDPFHFDWTKGRGGRLRGRNEKRDLAVPRFMVWPFERRLVGSYCLLISYASPHMHLFTLYGFYPVSRSPLLLWPFHICEIVHKKTRSWFLSSSCSLLFLWPFHIYVIVHKKPLWILDLMMGKKCPPVKLRKLSIN